MGGSEVRRMEDGERNKWAKLTHICHILLSSPGNPTCMRRSYVIYTNNLCVTHKDTRNINNETNKFFIFICKFNEISPDDIYKISNYKVCNKSGFISSYCIIYKHAYHSIKLLLIKALMGLGYRCSMKTSSLSNTIKRVSWYEYFPIPIKKMQNLEKQSKFKNRDPFPTDFWQYCSLRKINIL